VRKLSKPPQANSRGSISQPILEWQVLFGLKENCSGFCFSLLLCFVLRNMYQKHINWSHLYRKLIGYRCKEAERNETEKLKTLNYFKTNDKNKRNGSEDERDRRKSYLKVVNEEERTTLRGREKRGSAQDCAAQK
jgi:uncharacterized C2H2 Zn-finger protein